MKGENTKLKFVNCEWFACRDTWALKSLSDIRDFKLIFRENRWQVATEEKFYTEACGPSNNCLKDPKGF